MNQNITSPKYKTMLCRHFESSKGCIYKDKCQFAHGLNELRALSSGHSVVNPTYHVRPLVPTQIPKANPIYFKVSKCKNYEKYGFCKFEDHCSFAHGDNELRDKGGNVRPETYSNISYPPMTISPEFYYNYHLPSHPTEYHNVYPMSVPVNPYMLDYYGTMIGNTVHPNLEQIQYQFPQNLQEHKKT